MVKSRKEEVAELVLRYIAREQSGRGATLTRIMYGAYLSHGQARELVAALQERRWLVYRPGDELYRVTPRGMRFLASIESDGSTTRLEEIGGARRKRRTEV